MLSKVCAPAKADWLQQPLSDLPGRDERRPLADIQLADCQCAITKSISDYWAVSCSLFIATFPIVNNAAHKVPSHDDDRKQPRTHLFVAATLYSEAGSVPVRVRNMSPSGALIESAAIPEPGAKAILRRGSLHAAGRIAWKSAGKGGVAFETAIFVTDWMSRLPGTPQQQIDQIVSEYKSDGQTGLDSVVDDNASARTSSIEEELCALRAELAELEGSLVGDLILVATHPEIQILDISRQRIERIIKQLRSINKNRS